ncbi:rhamnulokinase [Leifsonia sp. AG29]|uniref:rhamnulokinase n=1 Tax=Leifsonia sp. AG29 TaxID=2598860 RepID=UPI00131D73AD|nr:rhamnulokinase family protein [Leifsonia sp. AG29]
MTGSRAGSVAAVDLGATSGRVMHARVGARTLELTEAARFANTPVRLWEGDRAALHWNVTGLFGHVLDGLAAVARSEPGLASIGVDSWAVDYSLLAGGRLVGEPYHYRDERTERGVSLVHGAVPPEELYREGGLQFLPFNSVYQLAVDRDSGDLDRSDGFLLIPDLLTYWLTGERVAERTNASTTALLAADGRWNDRLIERLGLRRDLFPPLVDAGTGVGRLLPSLDLGFDGDGPVVTAVGSHDTASAVVAVPMDPTRAAYISCGTWGLVGVELEHRVVSDAGRAANFTNEGGVDGRVRYLHNVMGLWLLSESLREWQRRGLPVTLESLLTEAAALPRPADLFDADDPRFLAPGDLPGRIAGWFAERGLRAPASPAGMVRVIIESLAEAFARTVRQAAELTGVPVETINIVGGGSRNALLCQATADRAGVPVVAGPVEATAIGNALVQARAVGFIEGDLETLRALVAATVPLTRYEPAGLRGAAGSASAAAASASAASASAASAPARGAH